MWWCECAWPMQSGIIRVCGLVGGSVLLCRWALRALSAQDLLSAEESLLLSCLRNRTSSWLLAEGSPLLLPADQDVDCFLP